MNDLFCRVVFDDDINPIFGIVAMAEVAHFVTGSTTKVIGDGLGDIEGFKAKLVKSQGQVNIFFVGKEISIE